MLTKITVLLIGLLLMVGRLGFADSDLTAPPTIPEPMADGESIEPEVNIIHKEDSVVEEYRVNGQLYMIKVIPEVGKPYYFIDTDGDNQLETRRDELAPPEIPRWVLFEW